MVPVSKRDRYLLALDDEFNQAFLLFYTHYKGVPESVCIRLAPNIFNSYLKHGHDDLCKWIDRIDQDYQVGRFSRDNPRLMMDYTLATPNEMSILCDSFSENLSLINQEAINILLSINSGVAFRVIYSEIAKGKSVPIEVFFLKFRFYDDEKTLLDQNGKELLGKDHYQSALRKLAQNPCNGCPEATVVALGMLVNEECIAQNMQHIRQLGAACDEYCFRLQREVLQRFLVDVNESAGVYPDYAEEQCKRISRSFRAEFPAFYEPYPNAQEAVPHWSFLEATVVWEHDYTQCLDQCFAARKIEIGHKELRDLLYLPTGFDSYWHDYSTGQAEKYCNVDVSFFTKKNTSRPVFPAAGNEDFIIGLWQHYFNFFIPNIQISREQLIEVFDCFVSEWNDVLS